MRKIILFISMLFLGCSGDTKTDKALLENDKKLLAENIDYYKISTYKFGKILIRSSIANEESSKGLKEHKSKLNDIFGKVIKENSSLSVVDYISIYRDYNAMQEFIEETDEDVFPTLSEALSVIYSDSLPEQITYLQGQDKIEVQNMEHAALSIVVLLSKDLGKEVSLYECYKTKPELLPDSELKTLLQFIRGFIFFDKQLYYLSEDEISRNIDFLNKNKNVELPFVRSFFQWGNLNDKQTHIGFHAMNHLFRGFDRLMMEREIDEERALKDFEQFLKDCQKLGLENEVVWSIETYLYLKNEEHEKAIASLNKLKSSNLLSSDEKNTVNESIGYLENRESGKLLNGVYDKYFLSKIATKYMFSILLKLDWEEILREYNVSNPKEIINSVKDFKELVEKLNKYSTTDNLKKEGENLWSKAKELTN